MNGAKPIIFLLIFGFFFLCSFSPSTEQEALKESRLHWERYYKSCSKIMEPTNFARYCLPFISKTYPLLEIGCGDGRDALFFSNSGIDVYASDLSETTIAKLQRANTGHFFVADFTNFGDALDSIKIGTIYSRFTLHSVNEIAASRTYRWSYDHLEPGGYLLLEVRTINDPLYGKGKQVDRDAFFTDHYRRFIRKDELIQELQSIGFTLVFALESTGFAKYKDADPAVLRIIAKK